MKRFNYARLLILALAFALLIGSAFVVTSMAEETPSTGKFGGINIAYGENVAICVAVNATKEEIENGDVVVSYTLCGETANATYMADGKDGYNWVMTEGISAYNLAKEVVFESSVNGEQVESGRTYSVAQFLYRMLYTSAGASVSAEYRALYESLLTYGAAAQTALNKDADKLVTSSSIVYTDNTDITVNGTTFAFAPAGAVEVTPVWNGVTPAGSELAGWTVADKDGNESDEGLTFTVNGVAKILSPIFAELDPTPFIMANGGFEDGLNGWTVVGNIGNVSSDTHYWVGDPDSAEGFAFGMDGSNMFSAYAPGAAESAVGTLTSPSFIVGGSGFVTFKLGAMRDGNYVYVDVVDADTKEILARYYNGLWQETTEGVKSGCTLVAYKADLSAFAGREVFFRISDNAKDNYALFFADSFNTYYVTEPDGFNPATPVNYTVSGTIYDVFNGGFELGDSRGWWDEGEPGRVTNANAFFNGREYGKDGEFLYSGAEDLGSGVILESRTGVLTSSVFELGGSGYITYMLGGGNGLCYVQVIDSTTGEILARYRQQQRDDAVLVTYVANLSAYIGRTLRIQLVDNATSDWGCVSFDNVVTYHETVPTGVTAIDVKYEIANGSFETGNKEGWKQNGGNLGEVTNNEINEGWYTKNDDNKDGEYIFSFAHFNGDGGVVNHEGGTGNIESSNFILKQGSYVSFRFGGAGGDRNNPNHAIFIQLCKADGTVIATFYNDAEGKVNTRMNAYYYQYQGEEADCFFRVVDNSAEGNYSCFVVDDFRVNLNEAPEGFIEAIQ